MLPWLINLSWISYPTSQIGIMLTSRIYKHKLVMILKISTVHDYPLIATPAPKIAFYTFSRSNTDQLPYNLILTHTCLPLSVCNATFSDLACTYAMIISGGSITTHAPPSF